MQESHRSGGIEFLHTYQKESECYLLGHCAQLSRRQRLDTCKVTGREVNRLLSVEDPTRQAVWRAKAPFADSQMSPAARCAPLCVS